jgi:hypothetical protein
MRGCCERKVSSLGIARKLSPGAGHPLGMPIHEIVVHVFELERRIPGVKKPEKYRAGPK